MPGTESTSAHFSEDDLRILDAGRFSSAETASYSMDMLRALKCIAERQNHHCLAQLLEAAATEAERLSKE